MTVSPNFPAVDSRQDSVHLRVLGPLRVSRDSVELDTGPASNAACWPCWSRVLRARVLSRRPETRWASSSSGRRRGVPEASPCGRAEAVEQILYAARMFPMLALVQCVRSVAALADGQPDDAFRQLMRIFDPAADAYFPNYHLLWLADLAEAAVLGGLQDQLRPVVAQMEPIAAQSRSPALRVGMSYARAVLTGDYEAALADDLTGWPFDRARLQLTYGAALRRAFRIAESRPLLRAAATTFDALGATPWADRARSELRATGETRRKPTDALDTLTPQEQQIARLTSEGLSNREIGERLFLSPRTVGSHLYRIYPKINVKSRAELTRVITSIDVT